ncbi:TetR/AcrR family transcriptional regulator [soil metagenome]
MPTPRQFLVDKLCPVRAKRERRKEARPGELLEAALDLFVEKGFAATRSEEVAARAGVSKGTLFLYFPSKEELFKAVVVENLASLFAGWNQEFEAFESSTADMLRYCMRVWWERVASTKASGLTKLMLSEGRNFPELAEFYRKQVVHPGHDLMRRILRRGIASGEFAPIDVDHAIYAVIAPMLFLMLWKHSGNVCIDGQTELDPETYLSVQTGIVLRGLLAQPGAQTSGKPQGDALGA